MSGFAASLDFTQDCPPDQLAAIASAISYRGRHHQATRVAGPCTLLNAAFWTTPEAELEDQPQRHITRDFWLTADARIDNQVDLVSRLQGTVRQPLVTDADMILASYERWGAGCVDHLIGDFGFALWDGDRQELLVARDHIGIRPVFFARRPGGVLAASTLPAVLAGLDSKPTIDEAYLAGYLAGRPPSGRTMWSEVERLGPGHVLRVSRTESVTRRYWNPSIEPLKQGLEDTVAQVRATFDEAVGCRMRTRDSVVCELSGGFDSSTVAAAASALKPDVKAVALAFRAHVEADERHHMRAVASHLGIDLHEIDVDNLPPLDPYAETKTHCQPLYAVDATHTAAIYDFVAERGGSVSLSGVGGDEMFRGSYSGALDRASRGHLISAVRWAAEDGLRPIEALRSIVRGLGRERVFSLGARAIGARPDGRLAQKLARVRETRARSATPWLFARTGLVPIVTHRRGSARAAEERLSLYVDSPWSTSAYELLDRLSVERGVEARYPFFDVRLIELGLRLPEDHIRLGGKPRGLHRHAFGDRLPSSMVARTDKAVLSRPYMRTLLASIDRDQAAAAIAALGDRVEAAALLVTYDEGEEAFERRPGCPRGFDLWAAISAGMASTL